MKVGFKAAFMLRLINRSAVYTPCRVHMTERPTGIHTEIIRDCVNSYYTTPTCKGYERGEAGPMDEIIF